MAKNVNMIEGMTLEQIKAKLADVVTDHNKTEVASERVKLKVQAEKLRDDYNKTAKLNAYAECLEADNPMLTFIKKYKYEIIAIGADKKTGQLSVKTEDAKGNTLTELFNLWDFVSHCEGLNRQVTAALNWKSKASEAKPILVDNIRKYIDNGGEKDVKSLKEALQAMFDAIIMIPGKTGNNAVIMSSKQVREIYMTNGAQNFKTFKSMFAQDKTWQKQVLAYLHCAVEKKDFTRVYGEDEAAIVTEDAKTNTEETAAE